MGVGQAAQRDHKARLLQNALFNQAGLLVTMASGLVMSVLVARQLGPGPYGTYSVVVWLGLVATQVASMGLSNTTARFVARHQGEGAPATATAVWRLTLGIGFVSAGVLALLLLALAPVLDALLFRGGAAELLALAAIGVLPGTVVTVLTAALVGYQRNYTIAGANAVAYPLGVLGAYLALRAGYGVAGVLVAGMGQATLTALLLAVTLRQSKARGSTSNIRVTIDGIVQGERDAERALRLSVRELMGYNTAAFVILLIDTVVWQRSEILFLARLSTPEQTGYYNLAYSLATRVMGLAPTAMAAVLLPSMAHAHGWRDPAAAQDLLSTAARYLALVTLPLAALGLALAPVVIGTLYGEAYLPAAPAFAVLVLSGTAMALGAAPSALLYAQGRLGTIIRVGVGAAALNLALDILLIPRYGALGAAVANTAAQVVALGSVVTLLALHLRVQWPWGALGRVALASAGAGGVAFVGAWALEPGLALAAGALTFAVAYPALLRATGALTRDDAAVLGLLLARVPLGPVRALGARMLSLLVPGSRHGAPTAPERGAVEG